MIGYVTLGTNDLEKAKEFYDSVFGVIGAKRMMDEDIFCAWSTGENQAALSVTQPYDKNAATVGNGVMVALAVDSRDKVDAVYNKAIEMGGSDEVADHARACVPRLRPSAPLEVAGRPSVRPRSP